MMMEASVSRISQVINMARTNTGQFLNNVICGRNITIINQTETVTNGFARLDEMGRKFHFTVTTTEPTDEHDNTTSQGKKAFVEVEDFIDIQLYLSAVVLFDSSLACKELFLSFGKDPFFKILWKQVKPFVRGKILYSPNTAAAHAIMSKVEFYTFLSPILALFCESWVSLIS